MLLPLASLLLLIGIYFPQFWVRYVMRRHGATIDAMPGTGGELAEHLLERFGMTDIKVEQTAPHKDHFDPSAPAVRLSPDNFKGKSLTAVAVAAHEVGHAVQYHRQEPIFRLRSRYMPLALSFKRAGVLLFAAVPVLALLLRAPGAIGALIALGFFFQLLGALSYLIVLPEEWDASFGKALPMLEEGYVPEAQLGAVRQVLKAAALTYFAAALAELLDLRRWLAVLRR